MEFFLDTGIIDEIKEAKEYGIIDGVTTNPSLVAKSGIKQETLIKEICQIIDGPISAEVISTNSDEMYREAIELSKIDQNIVIKLPLIPEGIKTCAKLSKENIKTNVTLCFSLNQALLAAKAGATYVSPFIGRLDDIGLNGVDLIKEIKIVFKHYNFKTKILAASLRHPQHIREVALAGADVATMPLSTLKKIFNHPLTDIGLKKFLEDHKNSLMI